MHSLKWWMTSTRMFFDENASGSGGGDSGSAPSVSSTPSSGGDGGSGSSSPAPGGEGTVSSDPSPSPDSGGEPASNDIDWSALGAVDGDDSIEVPAAPPAAPVAAPPKKYGAAAEVPPAPTPQAQPTPQPQTPPAPVAPPAPAQPEPAAAAPPVQLSPSDPLGIATALEANRDVSIAHLAQNRFALSQEDIAELEDNAAAFVPKMMARVHHEAQVSMMKFLAQSVPGMIKQFQTVTNANTEAEDQFFEANKALGLNKTNKDHRQAAFALAKIYRQANPDMPMEQLISDVGLMVAAKLKLPMVPQAQGAPAIPGSPQPVAGRPTGFRPAVNGGGGASPNPEPENEWGGLGRDFE